MRSLRWRIKLSCEMTERHRKSSKAEKDTKEDHMKSPGEMDS